MEALGHPFEAESASIWKYPIPVGGATFDVPAGAEVVHVGFDPAADPRRVSANVRLATPNIAIWARVDRLAPTEARTFTFIGTGHDAPKDGRYLGSAVGDGFAWHVFEIE